MQQLQPAAMVVLEPLMIFLALPWLMLAAVAVQLTMEEPLELAVQVLEVTAQIPQLPVVLELQIVEVAVVVVDTLLVLAVLLGAQAVLA
jgi:hypothetical protein